MTVQATSRPADVRAAARTAPILSALFLSVLVLSILRTAVDGGVLDLVMNYRADEGSLVEKLHPTFYGFAAVTAFALLAYRIELTPWETQVVRAMLILLCTIIAMIAFTVVMGIGSSVGFIIDNYVGACFSALLFLFPEDKRRLVGRALVIVLFTSASVALAEFVLKIPLMPHPPEEAVFRPVGLTSHPLQLGLWCAVAVPFATAAGWSRRMTALVCVGLVGGLAVSRARTAMLVGGLSILIVAIAAVAPHRRSRRRLERRLLLTIFAVMAVPILIGILYAAGALDRFEGGIADESAASRIEVYRIFDYMSWRDILFGIGTQRMTALATDKLHLFAIESAVVVFVGLFGVFGALAFLAVFLWLIIVLLRGARPAIVLGAVLYLTVALSNNALASKEPSIFTLMTIIIAFRPMERERSSVQLNMSKRVGCTRDMDRLLSSDEGCATVPTIGGE